MAIFFIPEMLDAKCKQFDFHKIFQNPNKPKASSLLDICRLGICYANQGSLTKLLHLVVHQIAVIMFFSHYGHCLEPRFNSTTTMSTFNGFKLKLATRRTSLK
jgi:hypothetical protein